MAGDGASCAQDTFLSELSFPRPLAFRPKRRACRKARAGTLPVSRTVGRSERAGALAPAVSGLQL